MNELEEIRSAQVALSEFKRAMRRAWPDLAATGADLAYDANWPAAPAGAAELAAAF